MTRQTRRPTDGEIPDSEDSWAWTEFGEADLGDARRTERLVSLARTLAARPAASLPEACTDPAQLKAAYRFFSNGAVTPETLLASHVAATQHRIAQVPVVLAVQDTTELDYTSHPATTGLGYLNDTRHRGLLVHSTLALTPERLPLGVLAQQVWSRQTLGQRAIRKTRAVTEKESQKWLLSLEAVKEARVACPDTHLISVGDREADVYDLFLVERLPGVDLLVRAAWDRCVSAPQQHLWATVAAAPVAGTAEVTIPRRSGQPARPATLTVRFCSVRLRPPRSRSKEKLPQVSVWAVWVRESDPPEGTEPIEWLLLTSCPVGTAEQALQCVAWYACRWGIEVWHKILKSGCQIEARQLEAAARLERCLTLYSVIAWRVLYATVLARTVPDLPCTALLEAAEWEALYCVTHHTPRPPEAPPSLRQAVRWIAQLGGFLARPGDGEPGVTTLWKGFQHLADLTTMYQIMIMKPPPVPLSRDVGNA
jgi:transposase-like protein/transposase Tn5 family protein